jgi:translation initiation factor IF-3
MPPQQALTMATERGLDLVEIAAAANPPVCRIMNSGKYFYQAAKREAEARKHQKHIQVKEVKFRTKIDEHDFQFKKRNVERFLLDGNKVKTTVVFHGREMVHTEIGYRILTRLLGELADTAVVESAAKQEGRLMIQVLGPKREALVKQKPKKTGDKTGQAEEGSHRASKEDKKAGAHEAAAAPTDSVEKAP